MDRMTERGITVRCQTVLQQGVNDDPTTMQWLVRRLSHASERETGRLLLYSEPLRTPDEVQPARWQVASARKTITAAAWGAAAANSVARQSRGLLTWAIWSIRTKPT